VNLSSLGSISNIPKITGLDIGNPVKQKDNTGSFDALLQSAMDLLNETNQNIQRAGEAELNYAMGLMTNTHELQFIQQKANISLQYTVAVRNAILDAYKEIMQIQF